MRSRKRKEDFLAWERRLWKDGIRSVAGLDEAGRGALAGPVVAAAVVFQDDGAIAGVDDSKKLSAQKRERLFGVIMERASRVGIGSASHDEIDGQNIYRATETAMRRALDDLGETPERLLVDGMRLSGTDVPQEKIIDGDARCYSIAAASIVAKVTRDRLMTGLDGEYPAYGFARHKGYGTRIHLEALREHLPCPVHRKTFGPVARLCS